MPCAFSIKSLVKSLVGEAVLGQLDFYRFPDRGHAWGGPFNGQLGRQVLFRDLITRINPAAIVETGTYLGTTTQLFAETGLPVATIEVHARNCGFASARLRRFRNVEVLLGDSRRYLSSLCDASFGTLSPQSIFFYLDAHWNAELPLFEELEIIFQKGESAVVMIDDFKVPLDPGYGYDDFGAGKALTAAYIAPAVATHRLRVFYPATPSSRETGCRRGCAVICKDGVLADRLAASQFLRPA